MGVSGATVSGVSGALAAGMSISGGVFFICTAGLAGGSGRTVIRAVSFFGLLAFVGGVTGKGGVAAAPAPGVAEVTAGDTPDRGVKTCGGAGGRGAGVLGLGTDSGGLVEGETGGHAGRLMRTVSRFSDGASAGAAVGSGGSVIRTVSFFGPAKFAIQRLISA